MSNQYLKDDVLFTSPVGEPITELRLVGKKLVLYTEDNGILARFRHWSQMLYLIPYTREIMGGAGQLVGADLYFPKTATKQLIQALRENTRRPQKKGGSVR